MRLRHLSRGLPTRMETSLRWHQERVAAFERGDGPAAEALTRRLIHAAAVAILRYHFGVDQQGSPIDLSQENLRFDLRGFLLPARGFAPPLERMVLDPELVKDLADRLGKQVVDRPRTMIKRRHRR
jgi:hypothetical protein